MAEALLSSRGLAKRFGSNAAAADISFALEKGLIFAIVGPAKSGKSTIAGLIAGTILPDEGTITLRGKAIEDKPAGERVRLGVAFAAGSGAIFPDETVLENVRIAREVAHGDWGSIFKRAGEATEVAAWRALIATNLKTRAGMRAAALGRIDKRWMEIAMALVCEPEVLVFDEPFAGAGAGEIGELCDFLQELSRKHAILVTDRSIDRVRPLAGTIAALARGRLALAGAAEEGRIAVDGGFTNA